MHKRRRTNETERKCWRREYRILQFNSRTEWFLLLSTSYCVQIFKPKITSGLNKNAVIWCLFKPLYSKVHFECIRLSAARTWTYCSDAHSFITIIQLLILISNDDNYMVCIKVHSYSRSFIHSFIECQMKASLPTNLHRNSVLRIDNIHQNVTRDFLPFFSKD